MELNYERLTVLNRSERDNFSLQDIGRDFIQKFSEYIEGKRKLLEEAEKENDALSKEMTSKLITEINNAQNIFNDIFERREKKMINHAILSLKTDANILDTVKMFEHEKILLQEVINSIKKSRDCLLNNSSKTLKNTENGKQLYAAEYISGFIWKNGEVIGPFSKGQHLEIPEEVASILMNEGKCEIR